MKLYLFTSPTHQDFPVLRQEYVFDNLKKLQLAACLSMLVSTSIVLLPLLFPVLNKTAHVSFYRGLNISLVFMSALCLFLEDLFFGQGKNRHQAKWAQRLCLLFALAFIGCCLGLTFIAQANPKNTLTMYLLGMITVAVLWDFEFYETLALMALTSLGFGLILQFTQLSLEQQILNHCFSLVIMASFFVLSRVMYSYRAAHFLQVKEIEAKNEQIAHVSRAKSEILGVVAHDLRSPFNNIEMITGLLQQKKLSPEQEQQYLGLILASCQSSKHIINELLYLAREEQQDTLPLEKLDLRDLLQEVEQDWQAQLQGSRNLTLHQAPAPLYAHLNKERFVRVMNNLLSNAVKFTPAHSNIVIKARQRDQKLLLEVADNGIGIPEKFKANLFDRFSKARRRGLKGEKSTGLGLSICRQLVEQHGGTIDVESTERQGTTFKIVLPVAESAYPA